MTNPASAATLLAAQLADNPALLLPQPLPCAPLDLLVALHGHALIASERDLARAQRIGEQALNIATSYTHQPIVRAQAHWTYATAILKKPDYVRSLAHYDLALAAYEQACLACAPDVPTRDVRVVQIVRVACLSELDRYEEAHAAVRAAETWLADNPAAQSARLTLLLNRSQLAGRTGDYQQMIHLAQQTVQLADQIGDDARGAQGWFNQAYALIAVGNFDHVPNAIDQGLVFAKRAELTIDIGRAWLLRARMQRSQGQLFAALKSLRTAHNALDQATNERATIDLDQSRLNRQIGNTAAALRLARRAALHYQQIEMRAYSAEAALEAAQIALQSGDLAQAENAVAVGRAQITPNVLPAQAAQLLISEALLALAYHQNNQRRSGYGLRVQHQHAQAAVTQLDMLGLPLDADGGRLVVAALGAQLGGPAKRNAIELYRQLAERTDLSVQITAITALGGVLPPAEALPYLHRGVALVTAQRRALPLEELQARHSSLNSLVQRRLAQCQLALGDEAAAYSTITAAKAGGLLDLRAAGPASQAAEPNRLDQLRHELTLWREQELSITQRMAQTQASSQELLQQYRHATAQRNHLTKQFAQETLEHGLSARYGQAQPATAADVQTALPAGTALLEFVSLEGGQIGAFLLRRDYPLRFQQLGTCVALRSLLAAWHLTRTHAQASNPASKGDLQARLHALWVMLIAPWAAELAAIDHLIIAPEETTHAIPWSMLGLPPLIEQYAISVTPSGALWAATFSQPPPQQSARVLCYAGSADRLSAPPLLHAANEAAAVSAALEGAICIDPATRHAVYTCHGPAVLHLIGHGHSDVAAPLTSTITFADGDLLLVEAHRLDLRGTRLVTLSTCESGVRPTYGGLLLAQVGAFLCAGAAQVLAALWPIDDAATAPLMAAFYRGYGGGLAPAEALRQAQLACREQHPTNWGAFQLWQGTNDIANGN